MGRKTLLRACEVFDANANSIEFSPIPIQDTTYLLGYKSGTTELEDKYHLGDIPRSKPTLRSCLNGEIWTSRFVIDKSLLQEALNLAMHRIENTIEGIFLLDILFKPNDSFIHIRDRILFENKPDAERAILEIRKFGTIIESSITLKPKISQKNVEEELEEAFSMA